MTLGFGSLRPLAHETFASDAVRVPRTGSLPAASFRFRLAADTLAVRLGVPVIKASIGTCTRPVASRFAFASRFAASGTTLRVMPDARTKKPVSCSGLTGFVSVGMIGFEPTTSWSQTKRSSQAELHPVVVAGRFLRSRSLTAQTLSYRSWWFWTMLSGRRQHASRDAAGR